MAPGREDSDCFCPQPSANLALDMRLLAEIIVIAALIYAGWDKPFKDRTAQALAMATSKYHATESALQKHARPAEPR